MFTGLIVGTGKVTAVKRRSGGMVLSLTSDELSAEAKLGDSISVNGVCLTVVEKNGSRLSFDLSEETVVSTTLSRLRVGDAVNLEPSLTPVSKIGGHFVTGHVDGVGTIRSRVPRGDMTKFQIAVPSQIMNFLVEKGSVAVDGISLTVLDIVNKGFSVMIIPHTAKLTTLGIKGPGDTVNIEADILGKYVARFLGRKENTDMQFLETLTERGHLEDYRP